MIPKRIVSWMTGLALVAALVAATLFLDWKRAMERPLSFAESVVYEVRRGASIGEVAKDLHAIGVIESPRWLAFHARMTGLAARIKAGEYAFAPGIDAEDLLAKLVAGEVVQHAFTIVEGWNFRDLRRYLAADEVLLQTLPGLDDEEIMRRLDQATMHPEGRFFPDTYHFPKGTADIDVLRRAFETMSDRLASAWPRRQADLPLATLDEALILASIVEKETGSPEERAQVAGVFVSRLRLGMRLQSDPTVIYGIGEDFDGDLRRSDLVRDTPYNTYVRKGLPPTPIAIPGWASIEATLAPREDGSLYFVSRGDGSHVFSTSYRDHRAAVRKYQLQKRRLDENS
ncbi:endolytic transglycosylase MltG [Thioalkalivibrio sp. HK1]|uniref:endolytic transglycosylase MltG n=1 Tax=Thioalkalivibrio sp. HK1 TaxID=1469245 RepID=UPI001E370705|nr:endolytic transglycosylase MltG [Thioalkalivibrio sp. HK1]